MNINEHIPTCDTFGGLHFFRLLWIAEISEVMKLLLIFKLSFSEPVWNNLNYASTANIREVMKFNNLGDKSFKTDSSSST